MKRKVEVRGERVGYGSLLALYRPGSDGSKANDPEVK